MNNYSQTVKHLEQTAQKMKQTQSPDDFISLFRSAMSTISATKQALAREVRHGGY